MRGTTGQDAGACLILHTCTHTRTQTAESMHTLLNSEGPSLDHIY